MRSKRICIYPKDVALILGISNRHASRYLHLVREAYGKERHQFVSIREFAQYTGLDEHEVQTRCF